MLLRGVSRQPPVTRPVPASCRGCVQGASADGQAGCQPGQLRVPPAPAHTGSHVADRTYMPTAQKALAAAARPGLPAAPAELVVLLPAGALDLLPPSLSHCLFSSFFFSSLPVAEGKVGGERGDASNEAGGDGRRAGGITALPVRKEMGAHPTASTASREVTSFLLSALCFMPQRTR